MNPQRACDRSVPLCVLIVTVVADPMRRIFHIFQTTDIELQNGFRQRLYIKNLGNILEFEGKRPRQDDLFEGGSQIAHLAKIILYGLKNGVH